MTAVAAALALLPGATVASAAARALRAFQLAPPAAAALGEPQLGVAADGSALVAASRLDSEDRSRYGGLWRLRRGDGRLSRLHGLGRAQVLAAAAAPRSGFDVLLARAPSGQPCCEELLARGVSRGGRLGAPRVLARGLAGAVTGALLPLPGHLLAAAASPAGVWVSQTGARGFPAGRRLSSGPLVPSSLAVTPMGRGGSLVAWIATDPAAPELGPQQVLGAEGTPRRAPSRVRVLLNASPGHQIDELALAPDVAAPALAWVETWFDASGALRSRAEVATLAGTRRPTGFELPREVVSAPALAGDGHGQLVLALRSCTRYGRCEIRAAVRPRGGAPRLGPLRKLGGADAGEPPVLAEAPGGGTLVAWVGGGALRAAYLAPGAARFGSPFTIGANAFLPALGAGPRGFVAAFVQGLARPALAGVAIPAG